MTTRNDFSAVPAALRSLENWLVWRYEDVCNKAGVAKRTKVPYNAKTGHKASSTNYKTWCDFSKAVEVFEAGHGDGIGFVVTHAAGFVGVDLDHCYDAASDTVAEWASAIVTALNSYTEVTPSNTGLRVFVRGALPETGRKKGDFEIYNNQRFLTITGQHLPGTPLEIHERPAEILTIHEQIFGKPTPLPAVTVNGHASAPIGSDMEILSAMFAAKNGAKVQALWHGDIAAYASQSEADSALCFHLAFWLRRDAARMDALFRQSSLMRPKWDEKHHADGETYGGRTIAEACARTTQQYEPPRPVFLNGPGARAYIGGQNEEHAEAIDANETDDETHQDSDPDLEAIKKGLYRVHKGRTLLLIEKEKSSETGGETSGKKAYIWDGACNIEQMRFDEDGQQIFVAAGRECNGRRFKVEFEAVKFADAKYVAAQLSNVTSAACVFYAGMEKHLAPSIKTFSGDLSRVATVRQFSRVGWASEGSEFIIPGMEPPDVVIHLSRKMPYEIASDDEDGGRIALNALIRAQRPEMTSVALSAALQAPLALHAGWRDERYAVFIAGRSGSFKSTWAVLLMSIYGPNFQSEDRLLKFGQGATNNALMDYFARSSDLPLLVDNYKPGTGGGEKDIVNLIHMVLEGGEKDRLNRNSQQRGSRAVHTWPFFTGEDVPGSDAASMARVIVVPFAWDAEKENDALTKAQSSAHLLSAVGGAWLRWLMSEDGQTAASACKSLFPARRTKWAATLRTHRKDMVNLFRVASNLASNELAWEAACSCPALSPVLEQFHGAHAAGLLEIGAGMASYTANSLEANRYLEALRALVASGRCVLLPTWELNAGDRASLLAGSKLLGWRDTKGVYLIPDIAFSEVTLLLRDSGGLGMVSKNTLHKQLVQINALAQRGKDEVTVVKKLEQTTKRVLHINPEFFEAGSAESEVTDFA